MVFTCLECAIIATINLEHFINVKLYTLNGHSLIPSLSSHYCQGNLLSIMDLYWNFILKSVSDWLLLTSAMF